MDQSDHTPKPLVYIRSVTKDELPKELHAQMAGMRKVYAVHNEEGERLALTTTIAMAKALALSHRMQPVAVN